MEDMKRMICDENIQKVNELFILINDLPKNDDDFIERLRNLNSLNNEYVRLFRQAT